MQPSVDYFLAGVVPVFTTIMPRDDDATADAQSRQVPMIDFHRELLPLSNHGLAADGIHPNVLRGGGVARPCVFNSEGRTYGYNLRNLYTIETLHRLREVLVVGADPPDVAVQSIAGTGAPADPIVIDALPFVDARDTTGGQHRNIDAYDGCAADQDESDPELLYRLELAEATTVRAIVIDRGTTDIDVHILAGGSSSSDCVARAHTSAVADLPAGTHYLALDTFVDAGTELPGEYLVVVLAE